MKLIGIRIDKEKTDESIRRNLSEEWYPFLQDYNLHKEDLVDDKGVRISDQVLLEKLKDKNSKGNSFEETLYTIDKDRPKISVHAIVGKNGSGKSTVLEILFRIINNFAYNVLGKADWRTNNSENLLYSDGLSAAIFYEINDIYYCLEDSQLIELDKTINIEKIFKNATFVENRFFLQKIFYTTVVNYSQYSLNIREFSDIDNSRIKKKDTYGRQLYYKTLNDKGNNIYKESETIYWKHWLNGLFHKNDGYLTPMVLNPMRTEGNIDFNTERNLSLQRLFGLLILCPDFLNEYRAERVEITFSMKKIKDKVEKQLNSFGADYHNTLLFIYSKWWDKLTIDSSYFTNTYSNELGINQLNKMIDKNDLNRFLNGANGKSDRVQQIQATLLYLAYKTIEIKSKYNDFDYDFNLINDIDALIDKIERDPSHITLKIRQAKNHINMRLLSANYIPTTDTTIKELDKDFKIHLNKGKIENKTLSIDEVTEILYPPVYETNVLLTKNDKDIKLWEMSSGERQMLYGLSSVLYHLMNLQSVVEDDCRVKYSYINVVLDEVEMYYHPEYQRLFIDKLLILINGLKLDKEKIKSINICIVTHSPFLLSDILKNNILFLKEGKVANNEVKTETFGANFYDILKNGFFLDENALGCFVNKKIKEVIKFIGNNENNNKKINTQLPDINEITEKEANEIVKLIGDPFLKGYLLDKIEQCIK
jgi:predicted ATPase